MKPPLGGLRTARGPFPPPPGRMIDSLIEMPAAPAVRMGRHGNTRTLILLGSSAVLSGATAWLILVRDRWVAGLLALAAAAALLAGSARVRGERHRRDGASRAAFAEGVVGRVFDTCVLAPLAWIWRFGSVRIAVLALVGLGASYVASYERAKGRSLGYRASESPEYRTVCSVILVIALLTGGLEPALWAFAVVTGAGAGVRAWNVAVQERRATPVEGGR